MRPRLWLLPCLLQLLIALGVTQAQTQHYAMEDFSKVEKIDVHMHIHTESLDFLALAKRDNFRFVNMAVWSGSAARNIENHRTTFLQYAAEPDRTAPVCSFRIENWDDPDWVQQTIAYLDQQFALGAVGVKIWKNFGMELRDKSGQLVMVDDPKLDPVIAHITACNKVLLGHLGEPKNCWLPLDEMTTNNDRSYFSENPQFHMALHPEMPSYEEQIAARDRMLAKHPKLRFVACHLASLECSVDEIAAFLDRFPNAVVGVAARMGQIQFQTQGNRQRVINFFNKYQDRILYGTDSGIRASTDAIEKYASVRAKWLRDWKFFNTDQSQSVPELDSPVQGLALEASAIDKIYRTNALRVFSASWPNLMQQEYQQQVDSLSWLTGHWSSLSGGTTTEESWLAPRNGLMLGVNRTTGSAAKTAFEFLRIAATSDGVFYFASPSGRPATAFRLIQHQSDGRASGNATFENLENDFPQRIIYQASPGRLTARIEGTVNGEQKTMFWHWQAED